jgi:hypothetical protein
MIIKSKKNNLQIDIGTAYRGDSSLQVSFEIDDGQYDVIFTKNLVETEYVIALILSRKWKIVNTNQLLRQLNKERNNNITYDKVILGYAKENTDSINHQTTVSATGRYVFTFRKKYNIKGNSVPIAFVDEDNMFDFVLCENWMEIAGFITMLRGQKIKIINWRV